MNLLTIREVAERLAVSERTVRRWIASGELTVRRLPGNGKKRAIVRIEESVFETFMAGTISGAESRSVPLNPPILPPRKQRQKRSNVQKYQWI